jgi:hypothetical protein
MIADGLSGRLVCVVCPSLLAGGGVIVGKGWVWAQAAPRWCVEGFTARVKGGSLECSVAETFVVEVGRRVCVGVGCGGCLLAGV